MANEIKKEALQEEELKEVTGGNGIILPDIPGEIVIDRTIPDTFKPVEVKDGDNHSALCPYCGGTLGMEMQVPYFADWAFFCSPCNKYFIKRSDLGWFEGPKPKY